MTTRRTTETGVTLVEASIILVIAAILSAAVAPVASRTFDRARFTRAVDDSTAIKTAIASFLAEFTGFTPFTSTGVNGGDPLEVLVSDGDIPLTAVGATDWDDPVTCCAAAVDVDFLERHLVTNTPIGGGSYTTGGASPWRGAYITAPIDPDPWGNRYAVNVRHLRTAPTSNDTFVLSAGPDEEIDTLFTVNGAVPGDDDIIAIVRRDVGLSVP
jgi:type II secretory pathway pseudopilin PulG